jgi:hypothetical protein
MNLIFIYNKRGLFSLKTAKGVLGCFVFFIYPQAEVLVPRLLGRMTTFTWISKFVLIRIRTIPYYFFPK